MRVPCRRVSLPSVSEVYCNKLQGLPACPARWGYVGLRVGWACCVCIIVMCHQGELGKADAMSLHEQLAGLPQRREGLPLCLVFVPHM